MGLTDSELVVKAKAGDKQAFTELFDRYKNKILGYIYGLIGNYQTAEDLTVETFSDAYRSLPRYQEMGVFSAWLYKIARDYAHKEFRRRSRRPEISLDEPEMEGDETMESGHEVPDDSQRPDYEARKNELSDIIYKAIARLDGKYKEVLLLCDVEGMEYEQAARVLKCHPMTIGTRLRRGRIILHDMLKKAGYQF